MEDTLEVSHRPYSSTHVLVCIDETSKQQVKETRAPLPGQVGKPRRYDYEYERNGVSNLFMLFAPLEGWRHVKVTDRRTNVDFAHCLKDLVDMHFPQAQKIVLMSDNLNTHKPAALYEAFSPQEARRIIEKVEWHHTPKHGSWLNMAEIELRVLQRQCLDRRIPDQEMLTREVAVWEHKRNQDAVKVNWRFTTEDARIKLKKLYPSF
jgi:DDE superfamily endonuclease